MILAVVGSRNFKNLEHALDTLRPESVLTGSFWGTDFATREWAMGNGVAIINLSPNFVRHGTKAIRIHNEQIAMIADEMLLCGDANPTSLQAAFFMGNKGKMVWNENSFCCNSDTGNSDLD